MNMLTQEDLEQISKLMDRKLEPIKQDLQSLKDGQARLEQRAEQDAETLGDISARLNEVLADHDVRIERLEKHTGLSHS